MRRGKGGMRRGRYSFCPQKKPVIADQLFHLVLAGVIVQSHFSTELPVPARAAVLLSKQALLARAYDVKMVFSLFHFTKMLIARSKAIRTYARAIRTYARAIRTYARTIRINARAMRTYARTIGINARAIDAVIRAVATNVKAVATMVRIREHDGLSSFS